MKKKKNWDRVQSGRSFSLSWLPVACTTLLLLLLDAPMKDQQKHNLTSLEQMSLARQGQILNLDLAIQWQQNP